MAKKKERKYIKIRGASEHNLKSIDIDIPRDEFVVLIPDCNEQKAKNMEKSFHKILKDMTSAKKLPFGIEASSGFVIAVDNSRSLDDYINEADEHMYQAKKRHKAQRD